MTKVEWMWKANANPFSNEQPTWNHYSDVENMIIEGSYRKKQSQAVLDDYYIDFKNSLQVSNQDAHRQRPVKRVERKRVDRHSREAHFKAEFISKLVEKLVQNITNKRDQYGLLQSCLPCNRNRPKAEEFGNASIAGLSQSSECPYFHRTKSKHTIDFVLQQRYTVTDLLAS